ncbi:MAG TPA: cell division topological specificity factor MinE [Candidatus Tectomicrobia bacterium]
MSFLSKLFGFREPSPGGQERSKDVAKERLKLALTYDRGDLARGTIEQLRDEIIQLIAKHLAINAEDIQINFDRTTEYDKLVATIPLHLTPRSQSPVLSTPAPRRGSGRRHRRRPRSAH